jgi:hypothetical protein
MNKARIAAVVALALLALSFGSAQATAPIVPGAGSPVVDGAMAKGEYGWMNSVGGFWLGVSLSKDGQTLTIGLAAKTAGWVSVGLGSTKMNGAYMLIAYDDGKPHFAEELGKGHGHSVAPGKKVLSQAIKTVNGMTYLEFTIPAAEFVKNGKLPLILGASNKADFISWHPMAQGIEIPVGK